METKDTSNSNDENNEKGVGQDEREQREPKQGAKGKGKSDTTTKTKKKNDNENDGDQPPMEGYIGQIMGNKGGGNGGAQGGAQGGGGIVLNGVKYDHVVFIDVNDGDKIPLGFNIDDDARQVSHDFCTINSINLDLAPQIEAHLKQARARRLEREAKNDQDENGKQEENKEKDEIDTWLDKIQKGKKGYEKHKQCLEWGIDEYSTFRQLSKSLKFTNANVMRSSLDPNKKHEVLITALIVVLEPLWKEQSQSNGM